MSTANEWVQAIREAIADEAVTVTSNEHEFASALKARRVAVWVMPVPDITAENWHQVTRKWTLWLADATTKDLQTAAENLTRLMRAIHPLTGFEEARAEMTNTADLTPILSYEITFESPQEAL
ncbi:hypothetical protein ACUH93_07055 [Dermabacteraceae bacterium P7006]